MDQIDQDALPEVTVDLPVDQTADVDDTIRRFRQIADLQSGPAKVCANQPAEAYADISAVTTAAGGGVNGAKNPADLRGNSMSLFPEFEAGKGR